MSRVTVVAEVGSVHDGSLGNALRLAEVAASCGADVVKFQTHIASAETLRDAPMPSYFTGEPRYEYFERTAFTKEQWGEIAAGCRRAGVGFCSSPFSEEAVELLEAVEVDRYKIASGEVTNLRLLDAVGRTGKPVLLSSGMSTWAELDDAVATLRRHHDRITVLQATSRYPCPPEEIGLNVLAEMRARYRLPVGLSDHSLTPWASAVAVALGAVAIERHITFSRLAYGSDAAHSLEPAEFAAAVRGIRDVEAMVASPVHKDAMAGALAEMKAIFEKSIVTLCDVRRGEVLAAPMLGLKKPGGGMPAARLEGVIGRRAARDIPRDRQVREDDLEPKG